MPSGLGLPWSKRDETGWHYAMLADASHANPQGAIHGGVLLAFLDHALSIIAWEAAGRLPSVTVQLNSHFVDAVRPGDFVELQADIVRRTRSMVFMRGILSAGDRQVVAADGIWRILTPATGR